MAKGKMQIRTKASHRGTIEKGKGITEKSKGHHGTKLLIKGTLGTKNHHGNYMFCWIAYLIKLQDVR